MDLHTTANSGYLIGGQLSILEQLFTNSEFNIFIIFRLSINLYLLQYQKILFKQYFLYTLSLNSIHLASFISIFLIISEISLDNFWISS